LKFTETAALPNVRAEVNEGFVAPGQFGHFFRSRTVSTLKWEIIFPEDTDHGRSDIGLKVIDSRDGRSEAFSRIPIQLGKNRVKKTIRKQK
jgi:hypothetical protein